MFTCISISQGQLIHKNFHAPNVQIQRKSYVAKASVLPKEFLVLQYHASTAGKLFLPVAKFQCSA